MKVTKFSYALLSAMMLAGVVTPTISTFAVTPSTGITLATTSDNVVINSNSFKLNASTIGIVNQAEDEAPGIVNQVNAYIKLIDEGNTFTEKSFNDAVADFANKMVESTRLADQLNDEAVLSEEVPVKETRSVASVAWNAGIVAAEGLGYDLTATLMKYAKESTGGSDTWEDLSDKYGVFNVDGVEQQASDLFEVNQVALEGDSYTTSPQSYTYSSGDFKYALHKVSITYAWVKRPNGTYTGSAYLTDKFDFDAKDNDLSVAGVANSVAVDATDEGYIKPFHVYIAGSI